MISVFLSIHIIHISSEAHAKCKCEQFIIVLSLPIILELSGRNTYWEICWQTGNCYFFFIYNKSFLFFLQPPNKQFLTEIEEKDNWIIKTNDNTVLYLVHLSLI